MMKQHQRSQIAMSAGLAVVTLAVFSQVLWCEFVQYDDQIYVTENYHVIGGLTWQSALWAFTNLDGGFWQPLTWLSHMLDCQLYEAWAGGHHLTNLLLHTANTILLFVVLRRMTGAFWRSAIVAGLFALHPLHVESVAWVAERKDVLSTLFWMLTLLAYVRYVESKTRNSKLETRYYLLSLAFFACGLMSKTMVVTLPVVMLLLDWWPLNRVSGLRSQVSGLKSQPSGEVAGGAPGLSAFRFPLSAFPWRLVWEKAPFFGASFLCGLLTVHAEKGVGALSSVEMVPIDARITNALFSSVRYLDQMVWPRDMAVFYPYSNEIPRWYLVGAGLLLLLLSGTALAMVRRRPYWGAGWFWYVVTVLPVIGLIPVGIHARADRYTYLPLIGVFIMVVWGVNEARVRWRLSKAFMGTIAGLVLGVFAVGTAQQVRYWRDTESLFRHAVAVTKDNYVAYNNLGVSLFDKGLVKEAMANYHQALEIMPPYPAALCNVGLALAHQKKWTEAIANYEAALRLLPNYPEAHNSLGNALTEIGRVDEAIQQFRIAIQQKPDYAKAYNNLGNAFGSVRKFDEAIEQYEKALQLAPGFVMARKNLALAYAKKEANEEAVAQFRIALRDEPDDAVTHFNLANVLAMQRKFKEAVKEYTEALRLAPDHARAHNNLGEVMAELGRLDEAVQQYNKSLRIDPKNPEAHFSLGGILARLGRKDEAMDQLKEALRLKPDYTEAKNKLEALGTQAGP